jgi:hypothetical protein
MNSIRFTIVAILLTMASSTIGQDAGDAPFRLPETGGGNLSLAQPDDLPSWLNIETDSPSSNAPPSFPIAQAIASVDPTSDSGVTRIPSYISGESYRHRVVRYEVPLADTAAHSEFANRGIPGRLLSIEKETHDDRSSSERWRGFLSPQSRRRQAEMVQVVRYEVPAEEIIFHAQMQSPTGPHLKGEIINPGFMPMPEVRFFQPKARVFMDLKSGNDNEFDLFADGAILASLDVIELHFPMPLISERFGELLGTPSQLSKLGWRVGGTVGLGIATALNNGTDNGSAPVTTLSSGIRYEFPLGRPSREVLETGDLRLDQRTRVGIELGVQGGVSTRESLSDKTDLGVYFGFQVDTPWGG